MFFFSYLIVMMPKDVLWRFGTELDDTSEIDVTAHVDVELGTAQNHRLGSWKRSEDLIFFTTTHNLVFFYKEKTKKFKRRKKKGKTRRYSGYSKIQTCQIKKSNFFHILSKINESIKRELL